MSGRVLITGASGYVGGRIADALAKSGVPLRLTSRQPSVLQPHFPNAELVEWPEQPTTHDLDHLCADVSAIIHLAALNEIDSAKDPERATRVNTLQTVQLLLAAERAKVKRFVFFSTAHVYCAPLRGTLSETSLPRPGHPYATTHLGAEHHVLASHDRGSLTGIVVRLSNAIGAPLRPDVNRWTLVANDLCRQAVTTEKLVLKSSGKALRDFVAMRDVTRAVSHLLELPKSELGDGLFNLGGGESRSVIELTRLIADRCHAVLGFRPEIEHLDGAGEPPPEPLDYRIDKLLGTGFSLIDQLEHEIDETLLLCRDAFGRRA